MLSIILFALAAIASAVMDTLAHHYEASIFYKMGKFWSLEASNATPHYLPFTKYKLDGWHVSKSAMVILAAGAVAAAYFTGPLVSPLIDFAILGAAWVVFFNLFYNTVLRVRKK